MSKNLLHLCHARADGRLLILEKARIIAEYALRAETICTAPPPNARWAFYNVHMTFSGNMPV